MRLTLPILAVLGIKTYLTNAWRTSHRRTVKGKLCAQAFVQDDEEYRDCTTAKNPIGGFGLAWCYVDISAAAINGEWGVCANPIDYDHMRRTSSEQSITRRESMGQAAELLQQQYDSLLAIQHRFNNVCTTSHEAFQTDVLKSESLLQHGEKCIDKLESTVKRIGIIDASVKHLETTLSNSRVAASKLPENCQNLPGYEAAPIADGIRGAYFAYPDFSGGVKGYKTSKSLDLTFRSLPVEGISPTRFSARWEGYLRIPKTGSYIISSETNCGLRVFINGRPIIVDRMPFASTNESTEHRVPLLSAPTASGVQRVESEHLTFVANQVVELKVELVHIQAFKAFEDEISSLRLLWRSLFMKEEVIPASAYFTGTDAGPLKLSRVDPKIFDVGSLHDGDLAFKGSETFYIADVPQQYAGLKVMKPEVVPKLGKFQVEVNSPATILIASTADEPVPIQFSPATPKAIRGTGARLSVYESASRTERAHTSHTMAIQYADVTQSEVLEFEIKRPRPFLIFFQNHEGDEASCGGEQISLSLLASQTYDSCTSSSLLSEEYSCESAFAGVQMDKPGGVWKTNAGTGIGEYVAIKFKQPVEITEIKFKPLDNPLSWPSELSLAFSDDFGADTSIIQLQHSNSLFHNTYRLPTPVITKYARITITRMFANGEESGGAFEIFGNVCSTHRKRGIKKKLFVESCDSTIENIPGVSHLLSGTYLKVSCPDHCLKNPEGFVYGDNFYSPDSTLCTAALHSGVCDVKAGFSCEFGVTVAGKQDSFTVSTKNGITSLGHGPTGSSIQLSPFKNEWESNTDEEKYTILFHRKGSVPSGYLEDVGDTKQSHGGVKYGWTKKIMEHSRASNISKNPLNTDGVPFPEGCDESSGQVVWALNTKTNGVFSVRVRIGGPDVSPEGTDAAYLQVNGVPLIEGVHLKEGQYYGASKHIEVDDNLIVLSAKCLENQGSARTVLSSVVIDHVET